MNRYLYKRIIRKKSVYVSLAIGSILSMVYIVMDVFPYRMYDGTPYNMWIGTYSMSQFQHIFFLILPILAAMPMSDLYYNDKKSGYINQIRVSGNSKRYFSSLFTYNYIVGGLCVLIPLLLNLYCCFMLLPNRAPDMITDAAVNVTFDTPITIFPHLYYSHPLLHIGMYLVINFCTAGMFASVALGISFYLKNKFFVILSPFIINYIFTMASYQIEGGNKFVPESFCIQLGGCNTIIPVIAIIVIGIGISLVLYKCNITKKVEL